LSRQQIIDYFRFALRARRRQEQAVILISALGPAAISRSRRNLAFS
jgi:hypothetical protein